eukprot:scaffold28647_cov23-Tisochrysis_lutea.AAC.1
MAVHGLHSSMYSHAIEFLARRDSNADTIPQNVGKLARSHKMATVLFMDVSFDASWTLKEDGVHDNRTGRITHIITNSRNHRHGSLQGRQGAA